MGSSVSEGVPGVWVTETVYVGAKNNFVRAHVVVLKDVCKSVVLRVEALVVTVGVDRSSSGRKSVTRAASYVG